CVCAPDGFADRGRALHPRSQERRPGGRGRVADRARQDDRQSDDPASHRYRLLAGRRRRARPQAAGKPDRGAEEDRRHQGRQGAGEVRAPHGPERVARRQGDGGRQGQGALRTRPNDRRGGPNVLNALRNSAPVWLSLLAGAALWEIVGRNSNPAFLVPLSETLVRLWQLMGTPQFATQALDSATLFVTGVGLGIVVGMPLGLLLARVRIIRVGVDPYIMTLYATPM